MTLTKLNGLRSISIGAPKNDMESPTAITPTASIEVVGNTGCVSSEKAGGGSTFVSGTTFQVMRAEFHVLRKPIALFIDGKSLQMRGIGGEQDDDGGRLAS